MGYSLSLMPETIFFKKLILVVFSILGFRGQGVIKASFILVKYLKIHHLRSTMVEWCTHQIQVHILEPVNAISFRKIVFADVTELMSLS